MMQVFSDPDLERQFRRTGFVVLPLLSELEVESLLRLHTSTTPDVPADYYATPFSPDHAYRRQVFDGVNAVLMPRLNALMPGYAPCLAAFITKRPSTTKGKVWLHQDYTFVDNSRHTAVHVWCPLSDVNEQNGCLKTIAGSHTFLKHISAIPPNPAPFGPVRETLDASVAVKVPMRAGSAFIYDERLLHGSDENQTGELRVAAACVMIPAGVHPLLYSWDKNNAGQLTTLELSGTSLVDFEPGVPISEPYRPSMRPLGVIDYTAEPLTSASVDELARHQHAVLADAPSLASALRQAAAVVAALPRV